MNAHHHPGHAHGDEHAPAVAPGDEGRVFWAMLLTGSFMVVEAVGGILSGSLALLSDAAHMLTDFASLGLAWFAFRLARRRPDPRRSYGYHRFQVLAAFVNGISLIAIVCWICVEALQRLFEPIPILGLPMLAVAAAGLFVNLIVFAILRQGDQSNLNLRGASLHVLGDLLGSLVAILAALVILQWGWTPIDPLLSFLVALLIARSSYKLVKQSGHILLEGTPEHVDPTEIKTGLVAAVPLITDVHHVHIWSLTGRHPVITLHAVLAEGADHNAALAAVHGALKELLGVSHATIQLERGHCPDGEVE